MTRPPMTPSVRVIGESRQPVLIIDDFTGNVREIVEIAAALAPFDQSRDTYYPGLRRHIMPADRDAFAYAEDLLEEIGPFLGDIFGFEWFDWIEASFSMIASPTDALIPQQRIPHFDSTDPGYLAILHYLSDTDGTAFYRQRATGVETVTPQNVDAVVAAARTAADDATGYFHGSDAHYEQIGLVEGVADRLVLYRGSLLHSGIIRPDAQLSTDPRQGRLTANLFGRGR
jgi:hypothetical protein